MTSSNIQFNEKIIENDSRYENILKMRNIDLDGEDSPFAKDNRKIAKIHKVLFINSVLLIASILPLASSVFLFCFSLSVILSSIFIMLFISFFLIGFTFDKMKCDLYDNKNNYVKKIESDIRIACIEKYSEVLKEQYGATVVNLRDVIDDKDSIKVEFNDSKRGIVEKLYYSPESGMEVYFNHPSKPLPNAPKINKEKSEFNIIDELKNV